MAGYDLETAVDEILHGEARFLLDFLQRVARRSAVQISYRSVGRGRFYVVVDGTPGSKIDALFQELMLNRGLYYYACSRKARRTVSTQVIAPILQAMLERWFNLTHVRSLRKHILGQLSDELAPGELCDSLAHRYEVLFRKWDLKMLSDYEFVRDVDDFLTEFMLQRLGHVSGETSPRFDALVGQCSKANIIVHKETRKAFSRVHALRTRGLHRLEKCLDHSEISSVGLNVYFFFQVFDELMEAQRQKMITLVGRRYRRIKYGNERWMTGSGAESKPAVIESVAEWPCHDCDAIRGQYHAFGCDVEQCPRCFGQFLTCGCDSEGSDG